MTTEAKPKKVIKERMCVACRGRSQKGELLRVVKNKDNGIAFDKTGKANGRGAYVCNNPECVNLCVRKKLLNRAFKCAISDEVYQALAAEFENMSKQN
jgi:predicted RNA-binding protein YlxR (DUF448 family)